MKWLGSPVLEPLQVLEIFEPLQQLFVVLDG